MAPSSLSSGLCLSVTFSGKLCLPTLYKIAIPTPSHVPKFTLMTYHIVEIMCGTVVLKRDPRPAASTSPGTMFPGLFFRPESELGLGPAVCIKEPAVTLMIPKRKSRCSGLYKYYIIESSLTLGVRCHIIPFDDKTQISGPHPWRWTQVIWARSQNLHV